MKKIAIYSSHPFEEPLLTEAARGRFELVFIRKALSADSIPLSRTADAVALFTSDDASAPVLQELKKACITTVVTRSAGYDHIDIEAAHKLGMRVANVPGYSPHAIAEHAVALMLSLSRHLASAHEKVNKKDFTLEGLTGFNLHGKTTGIIGTGKIGSVVCRILHGFGCRLLAYDTEPDRSLQYNLGVKYVSLEELCRQSDIISIHVPLNENTKYLINKSSIETMKKGVMLINTARGKIIHTADLIEGLDSGKIGYAGLDVYEQEKNIFFS